MEQDVTLNIHYSAPQEIWDKIDKVYKSMPYWRGYDNGPHWEDGNEIEITASVEPGGLQICGTMPDDIWNEWFKELKDKLAEALDYPIGEPEDGYEFKDWKNMRR